MNGKDFLAKIKIVVDNLQAQKALKDTTQTIDKISQKQLVFPGFGKEGIATTKQLTEGFKGVTKETSKSFQAMGDFEKALRRVMVVAPVWMAFRAVIQGITSSIKALVSSAINWEEQMAQIKRVGKGTNEEYALLSMRLLDLSKKFGVSNETLGEGAKLWAQQGRSLSEIVPLMEATIKFSLVTGKTVSESVSDITSVMKSYRIEANDATTITDKLIKVEQGHAITAKELASALKILSPIGNQFGITFEKMLGLITATHVASRATGEQIGNAWKTMFARMSTSAIPVIQNVAKIPVYLDKTGESTFEQTGKFRDFGDVLDELAVSFGTLNDIQQAQVASSVAMKRNINLFTTAMQQWEEGIKASIEALDSFGASDKAVDLLLGTTANKAKQLSSAWSELGVTLIDNGQFIKDTIDGLKGLVSGLNDLALIFKGLSGLELFFAKGLKESLDEEINFRKKQVSQLEQITKLKEQLAKTKEFEIRIQESTKISPEQKTAIQKVILERRKLIEETIAKQPEIEVSETFLEAAISRGNELQQLRDKITTLGVALQKVAPQLGLGTMLTTPVDKLIERLSELESVAKGETAELYTGMRKDAEQQAKFLKEIVKLRIQEAKLASFQGIEDTEERLKIEKEMAKAQQEFFDIDKELTDEQKEQISNEKELIRFSYERVRTEEELIEKRIELIKQSKFIYQGQKQTLELEKLQNQLLEFRLKQRQEEQNKVAALSLQYERATGIEKARIRRLTELLGMSPEDIARTFENSIYDKEIILDYWNTFRTEAQTAIQEVSMRLNELQSPKNDFELQLEGLNRLEALISKTPQPILGGAETKVINPPTQVEIQKLLDMTIGSININLSDLNLEDLPRRAAEALRERLEKDEEFQKFLAKIIRNKI